MIDLDEPATLTAMLADSATQLTGDQLVCIDEYEKAPLVLDAIKAEFNRGTVPVRFALTGSARYESAIRFKSYRVSGNRFALSSV